MSSDTPTPRTDAVGRTQADVEMHSIDWESELDTLWVDIAFARTLERELAEARKELAEYRAATDPHYVDELAALKAENARLAKALEEVLPRLLELKLFQSAHICQQALAARGRENDKVSYHADNAGGAHGKDTNDK